MRNYQQPCPVEFKAQIMALLQSGARLKGRIKAFGCAAAMRRDWTRRADKWHALGLVALCLAGCADKGGAPVLVEPDTVNQLSAANTVVVLLHGLARSSASMSKMETALKKAGYTTCNVSYPSTQYPIETLASHYVLPKIQACTEGSSTPVSFVTHSLGGIIVRQIYQSDPNMQFGRVVMLGPPNHGSELVDNMRDWWLFKWVNGPAGQQLGTDSGSIPNRLGSAAFDVGIIVGDKPLLEPFKGYIPGPSDGKVSLESAKLGGMKDYVVMPTTHALIMRNQDVIEQTISFLRTGSFVGGMMSNNASKAGADLIQ